MPGHPGNANIFELDNRETISKRTVIIGFIVAFSALALRIIVANSFFDYLTDDAYIFMRYAENFTSGNGLVYNIDEWVLGFSSPLYVFALSILIWIFNGVDGPLLVTIFNLILFFIFAVILIRIFVRGEFKSWSIPILLLFYFSYVDASLNGMETTMFLLAIFASIYALLRHNIAITLILAIVCGLIRLEGFLFLFALLIYLLLIAKERIPLKGIIISAILLAAYLIPTYLSYGTIIPHPIWAKSALLAKSSWVGESYSNFFENILEKHVLCVVAISVTSYKSLPDSAKLTIQIFSILTAIPFFVGLINSLYRKSVFVIIPLFYLFVLAFYCVGKPLMFNWYTIPTSMTFFITVFIGLDSVTEKYRLRIFGYIQVLLIIIMCAWSTIVALPLRSYVNNTRGHSLVGVAEFILNNFPDAKSLAAADIGILGYQSGLHIIDLAGLVTPSVLKISNERGETYLQDVALTENPSAIFIWWTDILKKDEIKVTGLRYKTFRSASDKQKFLEIYNEIELVKYPGYHLYVRADLIPEKMTPLIIKHNL
ncbi:MAG: hypothetical protein GY855_10335 [candidate division Zixibacteria bacterium]|nr:hypothetical protein [candidate division Zixibacteria bacterium]